MPPDTLSRVRDCIDRVLAREVGARDDQRLIADIGMDILAVVSLEMELEEEFKLDPEILDQRLPEAATVADVVRVVDELRGVDA